MALVAYDYSDDSDSEPVLVENVETEKNLSSDEEIDPIPVTFSHLPKPQYHTFSVKEIKLKNLKLASLAKVAPIQPHNPKSSKRLNFKKDTGLLSVLPKPENESSCEISKVFKVPSSLIPTAAKVAANTVKKNEIAVPAARKTIDEDEDIGTDFFSLDKTDSNEEFSDNIDLGALGIVEKETLNNFPELHPAFIPEVINDEVNSQDVSENIENSQSLSDLDKDLLQKICGRKRKGQIPENIQIIDINEADILARSKEVASKHFTDEVMHTPAKKSNSSTLSKRKHQITYLAFHAKERELELKNQWATNRATRKQTQSKYGF